MDVKKFRAARELLDISRPFNSPDKCNKVWDELRGAAAPEHVGQGHSAGFSDHVTCSCRWKSRGYWDMLQAAWDDWADHVADAMGLTPRKCPCGKIYTPADGGEPCHELRPIEPKK